MSDTIEELISQCLARGFCHKTNAHKEMDVALVTAMTEELMIMFDKPLPETVILAYETIPKGHTVSELLDMLIIKEGSKWR